MPDRPPLTCQEAQDHFSAYLDRELTSPEKVLLELHLRECSACCREADRMAALGCELAVLGVDERKREQGVQDVLGKLAQVSRRHSGISRTRALVFPGAVWIAAGVLLGVTVSLALALLGPSRKTPERPPREAAEARSVGPLRAEPDKDLRKPAEEMPRQPPAPLAPERLDRSEAQPSAEARRAEEARRTAPEEPSPVEVVKKTPEGEPEKPRVVAPRHETRVAVARLAEVAGEVYVVSGTDRRRAKGGEDLAAGQGVETVGPSSSASMKFADSTWIQLREDTKIRELASGNGGRIFVAQGTLAGRVSGEETAVWATPHGEVATLEASLRVVVDLAGTGSTRLEVDQGKARMTRSQDPMSVDVTAGHFAVAAVGVPLVAKRIPAAAQGAKIDPKRVDAAIDRGVKFLQKTDDSPPCPGYTFHSDELLLLTFLSAGVPASDAKFQRLFKKMLESPLDRTYNVALQAMVLEKLHRVQYQKRIWECAQFLVDTQCANGQWYYPLAGETAGPTAGAPEVVPIPARAKAKPKGVVDFDAPLPDSGPRPQVYLRVKKTRDGPPVGDNSDSQYAALGLRACHDAGILIPEETVRRAIKWWRECAYPDESKGAPVATGGAAGPSIGWGYYMRGVKDGDRPQSSITVGAVGSLAIYDYILGQDRRKNELLRAGIVWIANHFSVSENFGEEPVQPKHFALYYYLYGLERAGVLSGTEYFGRHPWYTEGARAILDAQRPDGSWSVSHYDTLCPSRGAEPVWDTCFAILFLKRATRPFPDVASVDRIQPNK